MDLRAFLGYVAANYDRMAGLNSPTQMLLRNADKELSASTPVGIMVKGSGGKGSATYTPWVGFFDPDVTLDPQEGIYVVYLFAEDLQSVTLTLNQGMEQLRRENGGSKARQMLRTQAELIRSQLPSDKLSGLKTVMELASKGVRQKSYAAGNIAAIEYSTSALPGSETLQSDLNRMLDLYGSAQAAKRHLLLTRPGAISSPAGTSLTVNIDPLSEFKPKSDADYLTYIEGRQLQKTRKHETLIRRYGEWCISLGHSAITSVHPRDLIVLQDQEEWLVEAKVLYKGNATNAVRDALGQLFAYRHFLYENQLSVNLLALFSEPIGNLYIDFLSSLGIQSVWWENGNWVGSVGARQAGLAGIEHSSVEMMDKQNGFGSQYP